MGERENFPLFSIVVFNNLIISVLFYISISFFKKLYYLIIGILLFKLVALYKNGLSNKDVMIYKVVKNF